MRSYAITAFALTAVLFGSADLKIGQDPSVPSVKIPYQRSGAEGTITGSVTLVGDPPNARRIVTTADPMCSTMSPELLTEEVRVNDGKLANAFVYVQSGDAIDSYSFEEPTSVALLARRGCRFEPHVLALRTGQQLAISNPDSTMHNTHPQPKNNQEWNRTQPPGTTLTVTFKRPEVFIPFKCNQHPWEKAYVGVFSHPFFAVTDESGRYRIEGLPPGVYTLKVWHERLGEKTQELKLLPTEAKTADFAFDAADKR